jgi:TonB-dependent receptor
MKKPIAFGSLLLLTTALVPPALAQTTPAPTAPPAASTPAATTEQPQDQPSAADPQPEEQVEVSTPGGDFGGDIVVTGRYIPEPVRATPEVVSVLSSADIARTGEGDIAGALQRVTGLSVVGNGFVYVRGLGDRYSLALLNGSPLPSPEPLRRVVPLDIFPTSVIASSLVQKSYSVNYPGEFGGGVINLTTKAIPTEDFLNFGASLSGDSETTAKLGYTYYGSDTDFLGFDDGTRDTPSGMTSALASGRFNQLPSTQRQAFAASLQNSETTVLQRNSDIPANFSADVSAGKTIDISDGRIGFIAAAGYSSTWRTRDIRQQSATDTELAVLNDDFRTVITENRVVANGLVSAGLEFGEHKIRWTNLYIRDTVKQGVLSVGYSSSLSADPVADPDFLGTPPVLEQNTNWFERQLFDTQLVGEFKFDDFNVDVRGGWANTQRESPYERSFTYRFAPTLNGVAVNDYVNFLSGTAGTGATISFSDLDEDVYSGAADFSYKVPADRKIVLSAGYAYTKTHRDSSRFTLRYTSTSSLPTGVVQERPDYLVSDYNIYTYGINLEDVSGSQGSATYAADLTINGAYGQGEIELMDGLRITGGVRYEDAKQSVLTGDGQGDTRLSNSYWLPAGTITWNFAEDMQFRLAGSKTIARPQFRELAYQFYLDYESDRTFRGNSFLTDSTLWNAEARYEWYIGRDERFSLGGFYKSIDNPIEASSFPASGAGISTGFANAPKATLYGGEVEFQKYFPLESLGEGAESLRLVTIFNYTYSKSKLKIDDSMVFSPSVNGALVPASTIFRDGAPLTGQSDHIGNVQLGIEDTDRLMQVTLLANYASKRVTSRGLITSNGLQPDIIEKPGFRLDIVMRGEVDFLGTPVELKAEARNITRTKYQEYQQFGDNRVDINRYKVGASFSLGMSAKF